MRKKSRFRDHQEENGKNNIKVVLFRVFNLRFSVFSLINKRYRCNKFIFSSRNEKQAGENLAKSKNHICRNIKPYIESYEHDAESHRLCNGNEFAVDITSTYKIIESIITLSNHTKFSVISNNSISNNFIDICNIGGLNNNAFGK